MRRFLLSSNQPFTKPDRRLIQIITSCAILVTLSSIAAQAEPVKAFLVSGQYNMTGRGDLGDLKKPAVDQKATLVRHIMAPENAETYKFLHDGKQKDNAGWTVRDIAFITTGDKHGGLAPNYGGFRSKGFAPELGIGHVASTLPPGGLRGIAGFHSRARSARPSVPSRNSAKDQLNHTTKTKRILL